jgi:hypothetical protein
MAHIDSLERALTAHKFPAMTPWWRSTIARFYSSGRRQLVLRVGRRGGKSSTLCRIAVLEALYGDHHVPAGDIGVVAIVSVSRDEASQRLRTIRAILDALGIAYRPIEHGIELDGRKVAFKTFVASVAGVVGFTGVCVLCDEVCRWRDSDTGANPATEVLASLRPSMAGQPSARIFLSSSPLAMLDAHYDAFELGETEHQCVAHAPTWISRPSLTEEALHHDEPNERIFGREYAAIPSGNVSEVFSAELIATAFARPTFEMVRVGEPVLVIDPSSGKHDTFAYGLGGWWDRKWADKDQWLWQQAIDPNEGHGDRYLQPVPGHFVQKKDAMGHPIPNPEFGSGEPVFALTKVAGFEGTFGQDISAERIVATLAERAARLGVRQVVSDQRESYLLESAFNRHGMAFRAIAWTNPSKIDAVAWVTRLMREKRLGIEPHEKLRKELLNFREKILPTGAVTYGARGNTHDDYVSLLLTAAMADVEGLFRGSPTQHPRGHVDLGPENFRNQ